MAVDHTVTPFPVDPACGVQRTLVLGVEWHSCIHSVLQPDMEACTLPELAQVRRLLQDTLGSVFAFLTPRFQHLVLDHVQGQLEGLNLAVTDKFGSQCSNVSIVGHSLGGTIAYSLLTRDAPKLSFDLKHVFYMGANLGAYSALSDSGSCCGTVLRDATLCYCCGTVLCCTMLPCVLCRVLLYCAACCAQPAACCAQLTAQVEKTYKST